MYVHVAHTYRRVYMHLYVHDVYIHIYIYTYRSVHIFFHFSMCMYKRPRTCGTNHRVYVCTYIMEARSNFFRNPVKMFLHPLILVIAHRGSSVLVGFDCARLARRDHKTANQRAPQYEIALRKRIRWRVKRDHRFASIFLRMPSFSLLFLYTYVHIRAGTCTI